MKKLFSIFACSVLLLTSCSENYNNTSSAAFEDISETSSSVSSVEVSEVTSSKEEVFEFHITAKTAVERIKEEIPFTADMVEIDKRFIYEKTSISDDMYEDFYGVISYERADNSLVAVFCCRTPAELLRLKQQLNNALNDDAQLSYLNPSAKVFSTEGYVIFIVTNNNYDEQNLTSKIIQ